MESVTLQNLVKGSDDLSKRAPSPDDKLRDIHDLHRKAKAKRKKRKKGGHK